MALLFTFILYRLQYFDPLDYSWEQRRPRIITLFIPLPGPTILRTSFEDKLHRDYFQGIIR